jgi:hypothetical protein
VALLERLGALRARPRGAGRRAHASRRADDTGARRGRGRARRQRDDGGRCSGAWRPASWWTGSIGASSPA